MQKLADICIRRPVFATMLIMALVVVGAAAYFRLGVDRLPQVDLPTVAVRTSLPGASPEDMETEVAREIEEQVNTVQGIEELRSISGPGSAFIIATFNLSRNIDVAAQDVRDRVATVIRQLPEDADPPVVSKFNADSDPVIQFALSGNRTLRELQEYADKVIKPPLERARGVGEINVWGGLERTMNVWVDADKLAAYRLPITAVRDALIQQNADVPGGNVTGPEREQTLRTLGRLTTARQFNEIVLATVNGVQIKVKDVGYAEDGTREPRSSSRLNGVPAVSIGVVRQSDANSVEVIEGVKAQVDKLRGTLPPGMNLTIVRDQSEYIYAALHEINVHLVLGSILACLVVLAFMRNWRSTVIAAVAIPASVISTFAVMWALGFTLNSVTMLALVLMVGIVIDDAIVVLENIFRYIEEKGMSPLDAAKKGTAEIGLAVLATTLSLVVIFIPVSFMSSVSGRFLYQFGITAAVAVMVSLLVSFTLTPMMSSKMLRAIPHAGGTGGGGGHGSASRTGFYRYIDASYTWLLRGAMRWRWAVAVLALCVIASSYWLYGLVRQEYTPTGDEAEFQVQITAPEGTSYTAMNDAMRAIEHDLSTIRGIDTYMATTGSGFSSNVNAAQIAVRLAPHAGRYLSISRLLKETLHGTPGEAFKGNFTQQDVMNDVRAKLRKYRDLRVGVRPYAAFNIGGGNFEIDFAIKGPELEKLAEYTEALRTRSRGLGILDADTTLKLNKPELRVNIDRERAADLGVSARDIGTAMRLMVGGDTEVTRFIDPATNEAYDVQLRLTERNRRSASDLPQLYLPRKNGGLTEVRNLATIEEAVAPSRIDRLDRQRAANLRAPGVAPGYALSDRIDALRRAADELNMPPAYTTSIMGRGRELERTFKEFLWAFLLSVIFMYMILAANYESLIHPFTILLSLPLSVPFALLSLYLSGGTLNMYSALGILVLFGVVKKNSILQIDHMNQLRAKGLPRYDAIIEGNRDRLRPILMTTLALVAGMLPLALGTGPGSEERRAVAVVVIGGQTLSLLLTLLVTPVAYSIFDDLGALLYRKPTTATPAPADQTETPEPVGAP